MSKKILFVSHDASRTGAPILLLNLLKWLKANTDFTVLILLRSGGELEPEYQAVGKTFTCYPPYTYFFRMMDHILCFLRLQGFLDRVWKQYVKYKINQNKIDLIYLNTIVSLDVLVWLNSIPVPKISHIHELEFALKHYIDDKVFDKYKLEITTFIAASNSCKKNLVEKFNVDSNKVKLIYEYVNTQHPPVFDNRKLLKKLNIPEDAFIVGCSGSFDWWRKGVDLFPILADKVLKKSSYDNFFFLWVGGNSTGYDFDHFFFDCRKLGIEKNIKFIGTVTNSLEYFNLFDVFVLLSREDTFPIACLEAATLGKPIICFQDSGGMPEFVQDDAGYIIPYLDIDDMSDKIIYLKKSDNTRKRLGLRACEKVKDYDINIVAQQIVQHVLQLIN